MKRTRKKRDPLIRLMEKVKINEETGCWEWTGRLTHRGYGEFFLNKLTRTNRASYELHVGPIPDGLQVLHHCDVRHCVNPAHLFLGTHDDNMADRRMKGRQCRLENHGSAKLTAEQALAIREAKDVKVADLVKQYGICQSQVYAIRRGTQWSTLLRDQRPLAGSNT